MYYRYNSDDEEFVCRKENELNQKIAEQKKIRQKNQRKHSIRAFIAVSIIIYILAFFANIIDSWLAALIWLACAPVFSFFLLLFAELYLDYFISRDYDDFEKLNQLNCELSKIDLHKEIRMLERTCSTAENMLDDFIEENRRLRSQLDELNHNN